jgi:hypothetical protein
MLFQQGFSEINPSGSKMNYLGLSSAESRPQKTSSTKSSSNLQSSGSASNANSSNGVYVDLGKALLEAAKAGDAEKVQECIKNGAPFITDWVSQLLVIFSASTSAFTFKKTFLFTFSLLPSRSYITTRNDRHHHRYFNLST